MKSLRLTQVDICRLDKIYVPQECDAPTTIEYCLDGLDVETGEHHRISITVDDAYTVKNQLNWFLNEGNLTTDEMIRK